METRDFLIEFITAQSCGEWSESTIMTDVERFMESLEKHKLKIVPAQPFTVMPCPLLGMNSHDNPDSPCSMCNGTRNIVLVEPNPSVTSDADEEEELVSRTIRALYANIPNCPSVTKNQARRIIEALQGEGES